MMNLHAPAEINSNQLAQSSRQAQADWIAHYHQLFTHAVTLTFNHSKVRRQIMAIDSTLTLNSDTMVELYKANMRTFKWRLAKSLYGNAWKRFDKPFVFVPVLEGMQRDCKPHYHCMLGVDEGRFSGLDQRILDIWRQMPFGGDRISVDRYRDQGWINYSTKGSGWVNHQGIDWENILVPRR